MIRVLIVLLATTILWADGGKLEFHKRAGNLDITMFSTPSPLRVGPADLSVMVQKAGDRSAVLDASVTIHLIERDTQNITEIVAPATHAKATNKLLYAATVTIPSAGAWRAIVQIRQAHQDAEVTGDINVQRPEPPLLTYWPYFVFVPVVLLLFVFNRWLKRRRSVSNRVTRT